jgi:hypothetical protein
VNRVARLTRLTRTNTLVVFSDDHLGADAFDEARFDECVRWCVENEAMVYLAGDHVENSVASGKDPGEKLLEQAIWPTEQIKQFVSKLKPLAKKGRIVGALRGNHEARTRRESLLDVSELIATMLETPYDGVGGLLRFQAGARIYSSAIHHGSRAGANTWLELDRMLRLYPTADVVSLGHNHDFNARQVTHIDVAGDGSEIVRRRWQVRSGTMLRFADYARAMCLTPSVIGHPIIRFSPKAQEVSVDISTLAWV